MYRSTCFNTTRQTNNKQKYKQQQQKLIANLMFSLCGTINREGLKKECLYFN